MSAALRAELLKLRTTRMFYGNALAMLAFVPVSIAVLIQTAGKPGAGPPLHTSEGVRHVLSAAGSGTIVFLVVGILAMAGELRHGTATATFLVEPDRRRVVTAKLAAVGVVGTGLAVVASALTLAIAVPWLSAEQADVNVISGDVGMVVLTAIVATALYAVVGVGLGAMVRNQTAAVVAALIWVMVVEGLLVSSVPAVGRWLPGGAVAALAGDTGVTSSGSLLPAWGGGLVFAAYGVAFVLGGIRSVNRKDIT